MIRKLFSVNHHSPDIPCFLSNSEHKATTSSIHSPPPTPVLNTHHTTTPSCFTSTPYYPSSSSHSPSPPSSPSLSSSSHSSLSSSSSSPQLSPPSSAPVASATSSDYSKPSVVSHEESSTSDCQGTPSSSIDYRQLTTVSTYYTPNSSHADCYAWTSNNSSSFSVDGYLSFVVSI